MKTILLIAAAFTALAASAAAVEPGREAAPNVVVRHADLDLSEPAQARLMLKRIRRAATEVCRASRDSGATHAETVEAFDRCYRAAVERGVRTLDARQVTAAYESRPAARTLARAP